MAQYKVDLNREVIFEDTLIIVLNETFQDALCLSYILLHTAFLMVTFFFVKTSYLGCLAAKSM